MDHYTEEIRAERFERTNICVLEYPKQDTDVVRTHIKEASKLQEYLQQTHDDSSLKMRLFVVEDLSRKVIETLGSQFDIDPSFFREHIVDYVWYNISKSFRQSSRLSYNPWKPNTDSDTAADMRIKRTGGEILQIWTSSQEAKTGFRCGL